MGVGVGGTGVGGGGTGVGGGGGGWVGCTATVGFGVGVAVGLVPHAVIARTNSARASNVKMCRAFINLLSDFVFRIGRR
jgi:hypothetical protein